MNIQNQPISQISSRIQNPQFLVWTLDFESNPRRRISHLNQRNTLLKLLLRPLPGDTPCSDVPVVHGGLAPLSMERAVMETRVVMMARDEEEKKKRVSRGRVLVMIGDEVTNGRSFFFFLQVLWVCARVRRSRREEIKKKKKRKKEEERVRWPSGRGEKKDKNSTWHSHVLPHVSSNNPSEIFFFHSHPSLCCTEFLSKENLEILSLIN